MNTSQPFKTGLVIYASFPEVLTDDGLLLPRLRDICTDPFFDVVELPYVQDHRLWPDLEQVIRPSAIDVTVCTGPAIVTKGWTLSSGNPADRASAVSEMRKAVDFAYAVGARELSFVSGSDPGDEQRADAVSCLVESINELLEYCARQAREYVLTLALEPLDRGTTHRRLVGPSALAAQVAARIGPGPGTFGITLDMSHIPQLNETFDLATATLGGLVTHAHVANTFRDPHQPQFGDTHPPFGVLGGEYTWRDIARFIEALLAGCFPYSVSLPYGHPVIGLEVRPGGESDPQMVLAGSKRALLQACKKVRSSACYG